MCEFLVILTCNDLCYWWQNLTSYDLKTSFQGILFSCDSMNKITASCSAISKWKINGFFSLGELFPGLTNKEK